MSKLSNFFRLFDSAEVNAFIDRKAEDFNKVKPYRDEMKAGYMVFTFLGLLANAVSMASAYQFFHRLVEVVFDNHSLVVVLTLIGLVALEWATVWLIYKAAKFTLHFRVTGAALFTIAALLAAWGNFYTSTTGLKAKSKELVSQHVEIRAAYTRDSLSLQARLVPQIDSLTVANSKLAGVTTLQNTTMFAANAKTLDGLREELRTGHKALVLRRDADLSTDEFKSDTKSDIFWKVIIANQIILFVSYLFTAFYYHKTNEQQKSVEDHVSEFALKIRDRTMATIGQMVDGVLGNFLTATLAETDREFRLQKPVEFEALHATGEAQDTPDENTEPTTQQGTVVTGFQRTRPDVSTDPKSSRPPRRLDGREDLPPTASTSETANEKQVAKLQKHATLVRYIVQHTDATDEAISNPVIAEIQEVASDAEYKSRTLIRELFQITQAIGRENVKGLLS